MHSYMYAFGCRLINRSWAVLDFSMNDRIKKGPSSPLRIHKTGKTRPSISHHFPEKVPSVHPDV